jgi:hypothetical protein
MKNLLAAAALIVAGFGIGSTATATANLHHSAAGHRQVSASAAPSDLGWGGGTPIAPNDLGWGGTTPQTA